MRSFVCSWAPLRSAVCPWVSLPRYVMGRIVGSQVFLLVCFFFKKKTLLVTQNLGAFCLWLLWVWLPITPRNKHRFILATKQALEPRQKDLTSLLCTYTHYLCYRVTWFCTGVCTLAWFRPAGPDGRHVHLPCSAPCHSLVCVGPPLGLLVFREKDWAGPMAQLRFVLGLVGGVRGEVIQPCCCWS